MKKITTTYWIVTGLVSAFIFLGALIDVSQAPDAVALIKHLGYPAYFVPFIGVMKILGVIAVLVPRFPKLKEWAYAGLAFDTFGAFFSHLCSGDGPDKWAPALVALVLVLVSYLLYNMMNNLKEKKQLEMSL
ncbi:DoxX family protein [Mucilaginibacter sp. HMF5004]|uniref:DoxX family protein n=1 Tax=Mucilaginibacter rivuli TaxID=2857527 RepID=UPI001C5E38BA|nr:DoxX family protein [Mucilaginibacter rivuli]MBW4889408.1 DoxX family protein [Mucilaginibacter rivuli]